MKAAIYTRISNDRDGAGLGVERQEEDCRALAERLGWEVVEVYTDNDVSASTKGRKPRPQYASMLKAARSGGIEAIMAYSNSRLTRRPAEWIELIGLANEGRIRIKTVASGEHDLTTANGRAMALTVAAWDAREAEETAERVKRAKIQSAKDGRYRGGPRPFGYEADGVTVRASEAVMIRDASRGVLDGRSLGAIAREWNDLGVTGSRGQQWNGSRVRKVLLRPRNAGLLASGAEVIGPGEWPEIVPEDVWRAVVGTLTAPGRRTNPGDSHVKWLGSGIYRCGVCELPLRATKSNGRTVYRCQAGAHVSRVQAVVDEYVESHIRAYLSRPDVIEALNGAVSVDTSAEVEQIAALRRRLAEFEADYARGDISGRQLKEATGRVESEMRALDDIITARTRGNALAGFVQSGDPAAAYDAAPLDVRRAVLRELLDVTVDRGAKGRPKGWRPGEPYSDTSTIALRWKAEQ